MEYRFLYGLGRDGSSIMGIVGTRDTQPLWEGSAKKGDQKVSYIASIILSVVGRERK